MGEIKIDGAAAKEFGLECADRAAADVTQDILEVALETTPYDKGLLHDMHKIIHIRPGEYVILADTFYSIYVHDGTRNHRPQPWLVDSIDRVAARGRV